MYNNKIKRFINIGLKPLNMDTIKSIAFDLEGTVIDVESAHHQAHIYSARKVGITLSLEDCFKEIPHFIGGPDEEVAKDITALASKHGIHVDYKEVLENKKNYYNYLLEDTQIKPRKGFLDFFYAIQNMGLKYSIGSLTNKDQALVLLKKSGLIELFENKNIVLKEDVQKLKPAPNVWIETAKRTSVEPSSQLVFEDSPNGIIGAVKIGAYCVGMPTYNRPDTIIALVNAGAKRIFLSWDEINPVNLINNINQEHSMHKYQ